MYMTKSGLDKFRPQLLKTRIARIARGSLTEGFPKSGHIYYRLLISQGFMFYHFYTVSGITTSVMLVLKLWLKVSNVVLTCKCWSECFEMYKLVRWELVISYNY